MKTALFSTSSIFVIIIVTILIMFFAWKDFSTYRSVSHKDFKSVIVSIGVLGTFVGIVIGLWFFDTTNIKDSVPELLRGLKIAFITSIEGMFVSVILSIIQVYQRDTDSSKNEIDLLRDVNQNLISLIENIGFSNLDLSYNKGNYYFHQNEYEKAVDAYRETLIFNPYNIEAIYKLGDCLLKQDKLDEAEKLYKDTAIKHPNNNKIKNSLNELLLEQERRKRDKQRKEKLEANKLQNNNVKNKKIVKTISPIENIDNLMWSSIDDIKKLTWTDAEEYALKLRLNGYSDWRLPFKDELKLLYLDKEKSKKMKRGLYWTIEDGGDKSTVAWSTYLGSKFSILNFEGWTVKTIEYYVICVREK